MLLYTLELTNIYGEKNMKLSKKLESDKVYHLAVVMMNKKTEETYSINVFVIGKDFDYDQNFHKDECADFVFCQSKITTYSGLMKELKYLNELAKYYNDGFSVSYLGYVQECYKDDNGEWKRKLEDIIENNPEKGAFELYA